MIAQRLEGAMGEKKKRDSWLEAFKRVRKGMPPPTRVKQGKKGKGVPYKRERERREEHE
jgi:hypothetical protein